MAFRVLRGATIWSDGSPMGPERRTEDTESHRPLFFDNSKAFPRLWHLRLALLRDSGGAKSRVPISPISVSGLK
jgi:hypothetical protein